MLKRFIFAALAVMFVIFTSACAYGSDFPASYDLRALERVTPVRNQEWLGTCWAFGVMGAVESNYLTKYVSNDSSVSTARTILGGVNSADLSELHMAWYIRNDPDKRWRETSVMPRNRSIATLNGASTLTAAAYLTRVDGPVLESSLPYLSTALLGRMGYSSNILGQWYEMKQYPTYEFLQTLANTLSEDQLSNDVVPILPGLKQNPETYGVSLRLTDVLYSSQTPVQLTNASDDKRDCISNDAVKALVMKHGGVAIGYQAENKGFNKYENSYYYKDGTKGNHEVLIVGWDDNYSADKFPWHTQPSKNGAWIVKNSWGTDWADKGYFYMSYEQYITEGAAFIVEDLPATLKVYQHDPLGWCSTYGASADTLYAANVFKVRYDNEQLEGISFYTTEAGATVDWTVYYNLGTNKPTLAPYTAGAVSISGTEKYPYSGYHTLKMTGANAVSLTKGTYFSVVLKITNPSAKHPLVVERKMENVSDFAAVHDLESWFSEDGSTWFDGVNMLDGKKNTPMNATIKAFTINGSGTEAEADKLTILGKNLDTFMDEVSVKDVESSPDVKPNSNIPDEPLTERMIFAPSSLSGDRYAAGTRITYYLANVTEDHEFVDAYAGDPDTTYPTGMSPYDPDGEYDPLFEEGYEPDVFWAAGDGGEYPVYGPFVTSVDESGYVYLNVHHLDYGNDSGDLGSIPKGYYDFVYTGPQGEKGFIGSVELRLAATDLSQPEIPGSDDISPDVIIRYESRDVIRYESGDVITIVSREVVVQYVSSDNTIGVGNSSSSGCTSGFGLAGLILLSGLAAAMKKR